MATAKKPRTPAQIAHSKKLGELAKARAIAKANTNTPKQNTSTQPEAPAITIPLDKWEQLMARVNELETAVTEKSAVAQSQPYVAPTGQVDVMGRPVGYTEKYPIDPKYYPNPAARLVEYTEGEPTLRRFNLQDNYLIEWKVEGRVYETKWGTSIREPFFYISLYQRMFDEMGEPLPQSIKVQTLILTEDEMEAERLITEIGIDTTNMDMRTLLNEVRFERIKRWLTAIFRPENNYEYNTSGNMETTIDGKVVNIVENSKILQ